jgi:hypothetical protein
MKDKTKAKKADKQSKGINEKQFLEELGKVFTIVGDKKDEVARVIKVDIGQGKSRVLCWTNDTKYGCSCAIFPPINDKWQTYKITNEKELNEVIDLLKSKMDTYIKNLRQTKPITKKVKNVATTG